MTQGATISERLTAALRLPNGARFYRCALQVNPFAYLSRHGKSTSFSDEATYNKAIIETCFELGIEVIGVTDHYRVQESVGLVQAARAVGLFAFSGFEATSKDGVHFLCLFDPDKDAVLERFIGPDDLRKPGSCCSITSKSFARGARSASISRATWPPLRRTVTSLLSEWEDTKAANYRAIDTAAKKVSRKLRERETPKSPAHI